MCKMGRSQLLCFIKQKGTLPTTREHMPLLAIQIYQFRRNIYGIYWNIYAWLFFKDASASFQFQLLSIFVEAVSSAVFISGLHIFSISLFHLLTGMDHHLSKFFFLSVDWNVKQHRLWSRQLGIKVVMAADSPAEYTFEKRVHKCDRHQGQDCQ